MNAVWFLWVNYRLAATASSTAPLPSTAPSFGPFVLDSTVTAALIQTAGTLIAALITALFARKIVSESIRPFFQSYSDKSHDMRDITRKARSDILVVTSVGDKLLEKFESEFQRKLQANMKFRYLFLSGERFDEMEWYLHGQDAKDRTGHNNVIRTLKRLQEKYPELVEARVFSGFLTASYICADIWPDPSLGAVLPSSIVQAMLYQYRVHAKDSPITYFSPKMDRTHYDTIVASIKSMWDEGTDLFSLLEAEQSVQASTAGGTMQEQA